MLRRFWRRTFNPPALEGQSWRVDGIGLVVIHRVLSVPSVVQARRISDGSVFEWWGGAFYGASHPARKTYMTDLPPRVGGHPRRDVTPALQHSEV